MADPDPATDPATESADTGGTGGISIERVKTIFFGEIGTGENGDVHKPDIVNQLLVAIAVIAAIMLVGALLKTIYKTIVVEGEDRPWIIKDTHNAKEARRVLQNPNADDAIMLRRSLNEHQGLEFTYLSWIFVDDFTNGANKGQWKHVFHKGSPTSYPNRAPGVWLHPNVNKMRIYMNTYTNISNNYVDIANIPMNKWYQLVVVVRETTMDIYINGYLKKRAVLEGIPRQNFGDLFITQNGGFDGYISRLRYFDYAAKYSEIEAHLRAGPSSKMPASSRQKPPYLTPYWWFNNPNAPTAGDVVE